jgi:hypothetical protein
LLTCCPDNPRIEGFAFGEPAVIAWKNLASAGEAAIREFTRRAVFYLTDGAIAAIKIRNQSNLYDKASAADRRLGRSSGGLGYPRSAIYDEIQEHNKQLVEQLQETASNADERTDAEAWALASATIPHETFCQSAERIRIGAEGVSHSSAFVSGISLAVTSTILPSVPISTRRTSMPAATVA